MLNLKRCCPLIGALSLSIFLQACDSDDMQAFKGYYVGEKQTSNGAVQVIANVPTLEKVGKKYVLEFGLFSVSTTTVQDPVKIHFINKKSAVLTMPTFSLTDVPISINGTCASGVAKSKSVKICWSDSTLDFSLKDTNNKNANLEIKLAKSNDLPVASYISDDHKYTLDEVILRSKFNAYGVAQEAERLFQAKKGVMVAVGNLLPHFNMRDLIAVAGGGPMGLIETVGDFLPFIFPSNWYKWDQSKEAYKAEKSSFASLRGNEMNEVEGLFYLLHKDNLIKELVEKHYSELLGIYEIVSKRERFGQMAQGSSERFYAAMVEVEQDLQQLNLMLAEEYSMLSHGVALPPASGIQSLAKLALPDLTKVSPQDPAPIIDVAIKKSYELVTLVHLIEASRSAKNEFTFGFLDPNSNDTIGFGYAASLQISKSKTKELEIFRSKTASLIEKRAFDVTKQLNSSLESHKLARKGLILSQKYLARLNQRLRLGDDSIGDDGFVEELRETSKQILKFSASEMSAVHTYLVAKSKIQRLMLEGYYQDLGVAIP